MTEDQLLCRREVAQLLSVCPRTVSKLAALGELPPVKIGRATRWRLTDVRDFIARRRKGGSRGNN